MIYLVSRTLCQGRIAGVMSWCGVVSGFTIHMRAAAVGLSALPISQATCITVYRHVIKHNFCPTCGIHPLAEGFDAQGNAFVAVNLRCIDGLDPNAVPVRESTA